MRIKVRKIKYRTPKFFGYKEDAWARLGGRWGRKRSYGHYGGGDFRTRAEVQNADDRREANEGSR